jgi:uracil-DNA glycosylase
VIGRKNARALARLGTLIRRCIQCPLHESRSQAVPGEGNPHAPILLVGAPPASSKTNRDALAVAMRGNFSIDSSSGVA